LMLLGFQRIRKCRTCRPSNQCRKSRLTKDHVAKN